MDYSKIEDLKRRKKEGDNRPLLLLNRDFCSEIAEDNKKAIGLQRNDAIEWYKTKAMPVVGTSLILEVEVSSSEEEELLPKQEVEGKLIKKESSVVKREEDPNIFRAIDDIERDREAIKYKRRIHILGKSQYQENLVNKEKNLKYQTRNDQEMPILFKNKRIGKQIYKDELANNFDENMQMQKKKSQSAPKHQGIVNSQIKYKFEIVDR